MIPKKPAPDLIRGGSQFSEKLMRRQKKPPPGFPGSRPGSPPSNASGGKTIEFASSSGLGFTQQSEHPMASDRKRPSSTHEQRTRLLPLARAAPAQPGRSSVAEELETRLKRLDAAEPALKAFVHVARDAATRSGQSLGCALAQERTAVADRRHAGRDQGHHRNRRYADRARLAHVGRLSHQARRGRGAGAARSRRHHSRQDHDDRVCLLASVRADHQPARSGAHAGRLDQRLGGRGRRRHRAGCARHPGRRLDLAARRAFAAASASSRRSGRSTAAAPTTISARARWASSPRRRTTPGRWRARSRSASAATRAFRG